MRLPRPIRLVIGLAAAVLIVVVGRVSLSSRDSLAPASFAVTQLDLNHWESKVAGFTRGSELPIKPSVAEAMQTIRCRGPPIFSRLSRSHCMIPATSS